MASNTSDLSSIPFKRHTAMSYYHKPRPNPLVDTRLFEFVDEHATKSPDKEVMVLYNAEAKRLSLTFKQLKEQSRQLAKGLLSKGLGRGHKILICAPNCFEFAVSWIAINRIGACAVLTCPEVLNQKRMQLLKDHVNCDGIVGVLSSLDSNLKKRVFEFLTELAESKDSSGSLVVKSIVYSGADHSTEIPPGNISMYEDLMTQEYHDEGLERAQSKVQCEDLCFSLLSTGTIGKIKAVGYTHHAIVNTMNLEVPGGLDKDSLLFSGLPLSSGSKAPSFVAAIVIGFTFVTAPTQKVTSEDSYDFMMKIIHDAKCGVLTIPRQDVPKMIIEKFQEKYDFSSVEGIGFGGQIVPRKIIRYLLEVFPGKYALLVYASVEVLTVGIQPLSMANINSDDYGKMFILPDIEVKVVDEDGLVVPCGQKGLIFVRGTKVFKEYIGNSELTAAIKSESGWVNTRDYGIMFEGGKLQVLGRTEDIIQRGDQKLFPVEFEDRLMEHQDILDAVIVGVPDKLLKEELCACVIEVPGSNLKTRVSELEDWCKETFGAESLRPKYFVFTDEFPLFENLKIHRRAIQNYAEKSLHLEN